MRVHMKGISFLWRLTEQSYFTGEIVLIHLSSRNYCTYTPLAIVCVLQELAIELIVNLREVFVPWAEERAFFYPEGSHPTEPYTA